ncbi:hypothetical protein ASPZODRAFT_128401 [Penicilliopsis zonata CBS 506.65]|uniref:Uncharacterized protein n=1 Tax=Penicilliopsis zonata CBS 506.65 TaxID=1073090 RepID=A0A1L9SRV3_9EURO|nr:hypothetical protein ASPZODRAFT_128401 [Penicilliopsis zonata CBS 506.65]OJJ49853.1 hypothetical protein ASPZODRAFT_128401 [Penicilliopsis zonata CBS 506.65]
MEQVTLDNALSIQQKYNKLDIYIYIYTMRKFSSITPRSMLAITHTETYLARQALHPEHSENSQSGTDDEVAHHLSSYDPSTTAPEREVQAMEDECRAENATTLCSPLAVSPGNREVSQTLDVMVGGAVQGAAKLGPSARGWTRKHKEVQIRASKGSWFERYEKYVCGREEKT